MVEGTKSLPYLSNESFNPRPPSEGFAKSTPRRAPAPPSSLSTPSPAVELVMQAMEEELVSIAAKEQRILRDLCGGERRVRKIRSGVSRLHEYQHRLEASVRSSFGTPFTVPKGGTLSVERGGIAFPPAPKVPAYNPDVAKKLTHAEQDQLCRVRLSRPTPHYSCLACSPGLSARAAPMAQITPQALDLLATKHFRNPTKQKELRANTGLDPDVLNQTIGEWERERRGIEVELSRK